MRVLISYYIDISGFIEELGLRGQQKFNEWKAIINLFSNLLRIDEVCHLWIEGKKYLENLKTIFNYNDLKFNEIFEFLKQKVNLKENSFFTAIQSFKKEYLNEEITKLENLITLEFSNLVMRFIKDDKIYKIKNRTISLQSIFYEYLDVAIEKFVNHDQHNILGMVNHYII